MPDESSQHSGLVEAMERAHDSWAGRPYPVGPGVSQEFARVVQDRTTLAAEVTRLIEQFETQKEKMTTLYAGYSAKCERWSLGTCDNVYPVTLCRICQFFTDLGYESFEVTSGGLRSWRPVKPLDEAVLNPAKEHTHGPFAGPYSSCPACNQDSIQEHE